LRGTIAVGPGRRQTAAGDRQQQATTGTEQTHFQQIPSGQSFSSNFPVKFDGSLDQPFLPLHDSSFDPSLTIAKMTAIRT